MCRLVFYGRLLISVTDKVKYYIIELCSNLDKLIDNSKFQGTTVHYTKCTCTNAFIVLAHSIF